ncbi:MAG: FAD-binding oxidoreductase [Thermoplasmatales archaeon]|nr:FAD-binding oxidoreductase [Thermoplasmatales archaeon]
MKIDIENLKSIVGKNNVSDEIADLYVYSSDASVHQAMPSVVVRPKNIEDVQKIMRYADMEKIPVVPRGAGSGTSGHSVPIDGGIVLDLKQMNRILEIRPYDMLCKVEPGVTIDDLNRALKPYDLWYPTPPESGRIATVGGTIANNGSGVKAIKYGAARDYVIGMKVVLANGTLITLGAETRVEASGYQLHRLMVGSEGTLGIIVEVSLSLRRIPKFAAMGIANFNKLEEAGEAISEIVNSEVIPSTLELIDDIGIMALNKTLDMKLPEVEAIIVFECDGRTKGAVNPDLEVLKRICKRHNGFGIKVSSDPQEMTKMYSGRKKLFAALSRYKEGFACTSLADDMAVPNSKIAECARKIHEIGKRHHVIMNAYGHCGSGVLHTKILMDTTKKEQWEDARQAVEEIYDYVRNVGGTASGEHGIALSKAPSWKKEKAVSLALMRAIKKAFDPNNILNPHKMQDAPDDWVTATKLRYQVRG